MTNDDLLTLAEVSKIMGVVETTITRWSYKGRLPIYKIARNVVRVRRSDLDKFLAENKRGNVQWKPEPKNQNEQSEGDISND